MVPLVPDACSGAGGLRLGLWFVEGSGLKEGSVPAGCGCGCSCRALGHPFALQGPEGSQELWQAC